MNKCERKKKLGELLQQLEDLKSKWGDLECQSNNHIGVSKLREYLKSIECQVSIIRLLQSESRLLQQVWVASFGFLSGTLITWVVQKAIIG